jgi:homocitrate synthase
MCPEPSSENPQSGQNGYNDHDDNLASQRRAAAMPYQPVGDFLSNTANFNIIESTLREGEQFATAWFSTETKVKMYGWSELT